LKKEAKTFAVMGRALRQRATHQRKGFLVLFFKKELLVFCLSDQNRSFPMRRALLLAATALPCALALSAPARAEAPFDFDHTPGRLPKTVVPSSYRIDIVPDLQKLTLAGHEVVDVQVRQNVADITLNEAGLTLTKVALENGQAPASITPDVKGQTVTLHFAQSVPAGAHTLTIDYHGPIPNSPAGIYYDDYKMPSGAQKRMLVTQFEVADARRMFPGWDEPAFKATFTLSAVLPKDLAAVSNMPITSIAAAGPGLNKVQFATSPRMSTYLVALVAGEMSRLPSHAGKTELGAWAPTGEQDQGDYALSVATLVLPYYNSYFGVKYPLPKLDLIAIPGNYEAGAMENWGAITFVDNAVLFDEATSSAATKERIHEVVAHEMAHQWSGDLVTMGWWDNIWLNEGFATWMQLKATDYFNPDWQIWPRQHESREAAMALDARPTTHPIQQKIRDETEAETAFDLISYQKGEQIIRMIEDWLTPDIFQSGMQAYMTAHAYGNATSADLWAALGKAANRDVASVAAGFTEQPGIPLVHVTRRCAAGQGSLTLTEDRFAIHDPKAAKLTWSIPITLGAPGQPSNRVVLDKTPIVLKLPSCDAPLKANLGENGYFRTEYDAASLKPLIAAFTQLDATDRANLLGDQFALFLAGRAPLGTYLDMLPALKTETNIAVWQDTLAHLERLDSLARGAAVRPAFRAYARRLLRPEFDRLGWEGKPDESFLDTLLRPQIIAALGEFDDADIKAEAARRFAAFVANPAALPPDLRTPVLGIVGHEADQATFDRLRKLGEAATSSEEKLRYFGAMASATDPKLITQTVQYASSGQFPNGRVAAILGLASSKSDNPDMVFKLTQAQQAAIRAHLTAGSQNSLLPRAALGSSSAVTARALLSDPSSHASIGAKVLAAQAADAIATSAELQQRAVPALADWLRGK
jgi:aminopeptidase N